MFEKHKEHVIAGFPGHFIILADIGVHHIYSSL